MKLNRRQLRRLIESVINEEENPGSAFGDEEMGRMGDSRSAISQKETFEAAEEDANKTLDWFMDVKSRYESGDRGPFVADQDYAIRLGSLDGTTYYYTSGGVYDDPNSGEMIPKGAKFGGDGAEAADINAYGDSPVFAPLLLHRDSSPKTKEDTEFRSIPDFYKQFEKEVLELQDAARDLGYSINIPMQSFDVPQEQNESLSRGSLYRRRYYSRY